LHACHIVVGQCHSSATQISDTADHVFYTFSIYLGTNTTRFQNVESFDFEFIVSMKPKANINEY